MTEKKVLLTGIQPTGDLHIGNYFGAMKQLTEMQVQYDTFAAIVNFHALTTIRNKKQLVKNTLDVAIDYLAVGVDPDHVTLYLQSDIPEVTELTWIFNNLVTVPYLSRAHAYKDKVAKGKEATVGLFDYPVLMAADILIINAEVVPVGKDNQQHIEIARDIATKFNDVYGILFTAPESFIPKDVAIVPGTDGQKMSKSYGNTIPLFASRKEIQEIVMRIVTDSEGERPKHVYAIHKLFRDKEELDALYAENTGNYRALKEALIEDIDAFITPLRKRRAEIAEDVGTIHQILANGADKVRLRAQKTMHEVREKVGLTF